MFDNISKFFKNPIVSGIGNVISGGLYNSAQNAMSWLPQQNNQQQVRGASTGPSISNAPSNNTQQFGPQAPQQNPFGGGGGGGGYTPNFNQAQSDIQRQYQDQQNQMNSQYGQQAQFLQNQLGDLGNQKNSLLDTIGSNYGGVIQQAKDTLAQNLGSLNQAKGDVTTGYENQKTQQAQLLGDQQRQNRETARALGDVNSSWYEGLQSKAGANTAQNVTQIGQQEQSQLDQIGQQIVSQNTDAGTKIDQLNQQEAQAKNDIVNKYQAAYNDIQTRLSGNQQDKINAVQSLGHQMQSTLDSLSQTMASYKSQAGGLSNPIASAAAQAKSLSQLQSVTQPIQDQQVLQQAIQSLQGDPSQFQNIVGQLQLYDAQNGTKLSQQIAGLQPQQTGSTGGFLGIGGTPTYSVPGSQGPLTLPKQGGSYLDQLMQNLQQ